MSESLRQAKAFDLYYEMGEKRSYEKVANLVGVSKNSIYNWARGYNWQERVAQRDAELSKKIFESTDNKVIEKYKQYNKIIDGAIAKGIEKIKKGDMKIEASDLVRLIDLGIKLNSLINEEASNTSDNSGVTFNFNLNKN